MSLDGNTVLLRPANSQFRFVELPYQGGLVHVKARTAARALCGTGPRPSQARSKGWVTLPLNEITLYRVCPLCASAAVAGESWATRTDEATR